MPMAAMKTMIMKIADMGRVSGAQRRFTHTR
jgi:hypothetical protein